MKGDNELIPLDDAAVELGYEPSGLRKLAKAEKFPAKKMGRDWFITRKNLDAWKATHVKPKSGRPRNPPK